MPENKCFRCQRPAGEYKFCMECLSERLKAACYDLERAAERHNGLAKEHRERTAKASADAANGEDL